MAKEGESDRVRAISEVFSRPGIADGLRESLRLPDTPPSTEISHDQAQERFRPFVKGVFDQLEEEYGHEIMSVARKPQ